jgi:molecular chaperone Hsp33
MDHIIKALARNGAIRIFVADTTELVCEAALRHKCYPTAAAALGRTMSAGALLGAFLKGADEKVTIQINGNGPLGTIMVDADGKGDIRGFVANPEVHFINPKTGKLDVGRAVGHDGTLKVIRDMSLRHDFTGTVELQTGEIAEDFAYYFTLSEQTPSAVSLGVLVDIASAEQAVAKLRPISTMINEKLTPEIIAKQLFDDTVILESQPLRFKCTCTKERMADALKTLERDEIEAMIQTDHGCEITCHFCNTTYKFTEEDLTKLGAGV